MNDREFMAAPTQEGVPASGGTHPIDEVSGPGAIRQTPSSPDQHQNAQPDRTGTAAIFEGFPPAPPPPDADMTDGRESLHDLSHEQSLADTQPNRRTIDDCINEIQDNHAPLVPALPRVHVDDGDTWVFINPPAREPEQNEDTWKAILCHYEYPFRVSSQKLKESESELVLRQITNPTAQFRLIRRFGVQQKMKVHRIKYIVDLTPPVEGDEAVELTEELSCPLSIVEWARTSQQWHVGIPVTGGKDELTTVDPALFVEGRTLVRDYTPLRHRCAIERVLLLLHGKNPQLDAAPKVYTTVLVATKHLQIPAYRLDELTGYVTTWITAAPNNMIIEFHPEAILKLAHELRIEALCQDAFAILVGEAALDVSMIENGNLYAVGKRTVHHRQRSTPHEVWQTRAEHARYSLKQRVKNVFHGDIVGSMMWVENLYSVRLVKERHFSQNKERFESWLKLLKQYIKGAIYHVIAVRYQEIDLPAQKWRVGHFDRNIFQVVFNDLDYKDRVMTRTFWKILGSLNLQTNEHERDYLTNLDCRPSSSHYTIDKTATSLAKQVELLDAEQMNRISTSELDHKTRNVQIEPIGMYDNGPENDSKDTDKHPNRPRKKARLPVNINSDQSQVSNNLALRFGTFHDLGKFEDDDDHEQANDNAYAQHAQAQRVQPGWKPPGDFSGISSRLTNPNPVSFKSTGNVDTGQSLFEAPTETPDRLTVQNPDHDEQARDMDINGYPANTIPEDRDEVLASNDHPLTTNAAGDTWRPWSTSRTANTNASLPSAPYSVPQGPPPRGRVKQEIFRPDSPTTGSAGHPSIRSSTTNFRATPLPHRDNASTNAGTTATSSIQWYPSARERPDSQVISRHTILDQAENELRNIAAQMLAQPFIPHLLELDTIDTLVCLTDNETKVLPLWAGGLDDGSGGVFNTEPPMMPADDIGFGPGRIGLRGVNSDFDGASSFGVTDSTANTSKLVNDGDNASVIVDRRQVYAASEVESVVYRGSEGGRTDSDWDRVSAMHTPQDSVNGDTKTVLPPESIEAPDFSDAGSELMDTELGPEDAVSVAEVQRPESSTASGSVAQTNEDDYMDMFADSGEEDFDEDDLLADDDDENMDREDADEMETESDYDLVEADPKTGGAGNANGNKVGQNVTATNGSERGRQTEGGEILIRYKEREPTPLGFGPEAD